MSMQSKRRISADMHMDMDLEVDGRGAISNSNNAVMCLLTNTQGEPLAAPLYLPLSVAPPHKLQRIVNTLLNNQETLPYSFYISNQELLLQLGSYLRNNKVSVEKVLQIVYQPQAIFRIRPVNRCSVTIAVLCVSFSPDGRSLASGSVTPLCTYGILTRKPRFSLVEMESTF